MKLNTLQWLWILAGVMLSGTVIADIAGIMEVPPIHWMLGFGVLNVIGWWLMPSLQELKKAHRRQSRPTKL